MAATNDAAACRMTLMLCNEIFLAFIFMYKVAIWDGSSCQCTMNNAKCSN